MAEVNDDGAIFDVEAFGLFGADQVQIHYDPAPAPIPPDLEERIATAWAAMKAECDASGAVLFNGPLVKLLASRVNGETLQLRTGPTDYRTFVGTNLAAPNDAASVDRDAYSNPIGTTATVISPDGYLLYGRRNRRVAYHAGYLHTIGGALEPSETAANGKLDAFASVRRELEEELGVSADEIEEIRCLGLIRDREIHQPELIFDAVVSPSRDQLLGRLDPDDPHQEHSALETVADAPDGLVPFIHAARPIAPVAVGAILLHGRRRWGEQWYAQSVAQIRKNH